MQRGGILIVDDERQIAEMLERLLRRLGYPAHVAFGGEQALAYMRDDLPALVILDLMMPHVDGMEVLRWMRRDERTRAVPVVMFTAVAEADIRDRAIAAGATDFWAKGAVDFGKLGERLRPYLGEPAARRVE